MSNCCVTNNCVEIVPSGCVRYTGAIAPAGLIVKQNYCDPYLNDIVNLFDVTLADLDKRLGLDKIEFDNINNSCGGTTVVNTSSFTVKDGKYYSSDVVKSLVGVICELRSRLNYLTSENTNVNQGNLHWEDLALSADFINYLRANASCISDACGVTDVLTLSDLLKALAVKICQCCS